MTQDQINAKIAKNNFKHSNKVLKEQFLTTLLSYSNKLPNWGGLNIKVL